MTVRYWLGSIRYGNFPGIPTSYQPHEGLLHRQFKCQTSEDFLDAFSVEGNRILTTE
ncbi:predicted protein [Sclerotinia sclerotiorum 1980 UF-70]|uniref:Uncharacterized protein n=1 Tax=Sclerotinia sclerotiorum (strain ATCC 18683 / 1980 / Ss-1) TaxID=665079 RepID=A7E495_SCLS1|nr:predicted protein [Sclerotinia sclerotiorum 1980 UF-70]EDN90717.1 predicted protein [Sclerotinia sclerotiorum 1980 UF-70]